MKVKFVVAVLLMFFAQLVSAQNNEVLTNKTVTELYKAGLDSSIIISKIESSNCKFDVSSTGLVSLKKSGVPSCVIKAMLDKQPDNMIRQCQAIGKSFSKSENKIKTARLWRRQCCSRN